MKNTVIIIPARLGAKRLKGKPLMHVKGTPIIIHVLKSAIKSGIGEVYVTSPDKEILEIVSNHVGKTIMTGNHPNGTSRVYEAFKKIKKVATTVKNRLPLSRPAISSTWFTRNSRPPSTKFWAPLGKSFIERVASHVVIPRKMITAQAVIIVFEISHEPTTELGPRTMISPATMISGLGPESTIQPTIIQASTPITLRAIQVFLN